MEPRNPNPWWATSRCATYMCHPSPARVPLECTEKPERCVVQPLVHVATDKTDVVCIFRFQRTAVWDARVHVRLPARHDGTLWPRDVTLHLVNEMCINTNFSDVAWRINGEANAVLAALKRGSCAECDALVRWSRDVLVVFRRVMPYLCLSLVLGYVWRAREYHCFCYASLPRAARRLVSAHAWHVALPLMGAFHDEPMHVRNWCTWRVHVATSRGAQSMVHCGGDADPCGEPTDGLHQAARTDAHLARIRVTNLSFLCGDVEREWFVRFGEGQPFEQRMPQCIQLAPGRLRSDGHGALVVPGSYMEVPFRAPLPTCEATASVLLVCEPVSRAPRTLAECSAALADGGEQHHSWIPSVSMPDVLFDDAWLRVHGSHVSFHARRLTELPWLHAYVIRLGVSGHSIDSCFPEWDSWSEWACFDLFRFDDVVTLAFRNVRAPFRCTAHAWAGNVLRHYYFTSALAFA